MKKSRYMEGPVIRMNPCHLFISGFLTDRTVNLRTPSRREEARSPVVLGMLVSMAAA